MFLGIACGIIYILCIFHDCISLDNCRHHYGIIGELNWNEITTVLINGFVKTLDSIGIIIAFGTITGAYVENGSLAKTMANWGIKTIVKTNSY